MALENNNSNLTEETGGTAEVQEVAGTEEAQGITETGREQTAETERGIGTEAGTPMDEANPEEVTDEKAVSVLDQMDESELRALSDDMLKFISQVLSLTSPPREMTTEECDNQPGILKEIYTSEWLEYISNIVAKGSQPEARMIALGVKSLQKSLDPVEQCEALRLGGANEILLILDKWWELRNTLAVLREAREELYGVTALLDKLDTRAPIYESHVLGVKALSPNATRSSYHSDGRLGKWIQRAQHEVAICLNETDSHIDRLDSACDEILEACQGMLTCWFNPYPGMDLLNTEFYRFLLNANISDDFIASLGNLLDLHESLINRTDVQKWKPLLPAVKAYISGNTPILQGSRLDSLIKACEKQVDVCNNHRVLIGDIASMFCDTLYVMDDDIDDPATAHHS